MAEKSKILVIGGSGYIGKFIVEASAKAGHSTSALIREETLLAKSQLIDNFNNLGVNLIIGDVNDHECLVKAMKKVDVVISTVSRQVTPNQVKIISAIKEAGNIKRFLPSEFGNDVDRSNAVDPAKTVLGMKAQIRRAVEAEGIPYTYVCCNFFAGYFLFNMTEPGAISPSSDKVLILGDGTTKVVFNKEEDIGNYTIRAVDDPRTLNKILYIRPPSNTISYNYLVSLWEKKVGKNVEKVYVAEADVLKNIQEAKYPASFVWAIRHAAAVKGDHTNFDIDPSFGVEATALYPDMEYTTLEEYLSQFDQFV